MLPSHQLCQGRLLDVTHNPSGIHCNGKVRMEKQTSKKKPRKPRKGSESSAPLSDLRLEKVVCTEAGTLLKDTLRNKGHEQLVEKLSGRLHWQARDLHKSHVQV